MEQSHVIRHGCTPKKINSRSLAATLVELTASMAIVSVLLLAIGAAMVLATKAIPKSDSHNTIIAESLRVANDLTNDLRYAVTFNERSSNAIEFAIPDRDGDTVPDIIRYEWSNVPGDPLTYSYNNSLPVVIHDNIQLLEFTYTTKTVTDQTQQPPLVESAETLWLQQDDTNSGIKTTKNIRNSQEAAQYFLPSLPPDAVSWSITRAQFMADPQNPINGVFTVEIKSAQTTGEPSTGNIESITVQESSLIPSQWHNITFNNVNELDPTSGYFMAFMYTSGTTTVAKLTIGDNSTASPDTKYYDNTTSGWVLDTTKDIWLWVWGTVTTPDPNWTPPTITILKNVNINLQAGSDPLTRVDTSAQIINQPQIVP